MSDIVERIQKLVLTTAEEDAAVGEITRQQAVIVMLEEAVVAMAEDGWLHHGPEGMSDAQAKCYVAWLAVRKEKTE